MSTATKTVREYLAAVHGSRHVEALGDDHGLDLDVPAASTGILNANHPRGLTPREIADLDAPRMAMKQAAHAWTEARRDAKDAPTDARRAAKADAARKAYIATLRGVGVPAKGGAL